MLLNNPIVILLFLYICPMGQKKEHLVKGGQRVPTLPPARKSRRHRQGRQSRRFPAAGRLSRLPLPRHGGIEIVVILIHAMQVTLIPLHLSKVLRIQGPPLASNTCSAMPNSAAYTMYSCQSTVSDTVRSASREKSSR